MGGWVLGAGGGPLHIIGRWRIESSCSVPLESSLNTHTHTYTQRSWLALDRWAGRTKRGNMKSCWWVEEEGGVVYKTRFCKKEKNPQRKKL